MISPGRTWQQRRVRRVIPLCSFCCVALCRGCFHVRWRYLYYSHWCRIYISPRRQLCVFSSIKLFFREWRNRRKLQTQLNFPGSPCFLTRVRVTVRRGERPYMSDYLQTTLTWPDVYAHTHTESQGIVLGGKAFLKCGNSVTFRRTHCSCWMFHPQALLSVAAAAPTSTRPELVTVVIRLRYVRTGCAHTHTHFLFTWKQPIKLRRDLSWHHTSEA